MTTGDRVSIPTTGVYGRDCVEVTAVRARWFDWRSLTRDARGSFPLSRLSEVWSLCEHMNDETVCAECETPA